MADPKREPRIQNDRFQVSDFTVGRFDAKSEIGTTQEDLLTPEYWSHVSERMTPYSEVTVRCDDGTYYAKFLVLDCGRGWAKMQLLNWWSLTTADVAQTQSSVGTAADYDILWKGSTRKHIVQRKSDQIVLHEGEQRKDAAVAWLNEFLIDKAKVQKSVEEPS